MSGIDRITIDPAVCGGRPCMRGIRIRVKDVLDLLAAGTAREEIFADFPYLESEEITAALEFAARELPLEKPMQAQAVIHCDPEILSGTPVFVGTRVPFQTLMEYLEDGLPLSEFLEDFPTVSQAQAITALVQAHDALIDRIARR